MVPAITLIRAELIISSLDRKTGAFDPAILDAFTRLASNVLWIAVLLAVLTSHL